MPERLLKPRPMIAIEVCATCGREHADARAYRRCSVCGRAFCWDGEPRGASAGPSTSSGRGSAQGANLLGVEARPCGSRRDVSAETDERRRVEYRCRAHVTRSWALFGMDWAAVRPLAMYVLLAVGFSLAFWGLVFYAVTAWLRERGIG